MLGRDISEALGGIAEDKIEAAAKAAGKGRNVWRSVAAVAAMVALVVAVFAVLPRVWEQEPQLGLPTFGVSGEQTLPTDQVLETMPQKFFAAPGILKVYSYSKVGATEEELKEHQITDSVTSYMPLWSPYINIICTGIPLLFQMPDDYFGDAKIRFEITADYGCFWTYIAGEEHLEQYYDDNNMTLDNGAYVYWDGIDDQRAFIEKVGDGGKFFVDILIYADEELVGYGVITMVYFESNGISFCRMDRCKTLCFPLVDGEFQEVTNAYVAEQMEEYKNVEMLREWVNPMG